MIETSKELVRKRRDVFNTTRWLLFLGLGVTSLVLTHWITGSFWPILHFNLYVLILLFWGLATQAATARCRRLGLSLDGTTVEKMERTSNVQERLEGTQEPLIIRSNPSGRFIMPICATLLCIVCIGPPLFRKSHPLDLEHIGHTTGHVLIFSSLAALAICSWVNLRKPEVKADARGVGHCDALGIHSNFAYWTKIESYDVVTERNVFGEIIQQSVVLRNAGHKKLMTVRIASHAREENQQNTERLVNFLKNILVSGSTIGEQGTPFRPSGYGGELAVHGHGSS